MRSCPRENNTQRSANSPSQSNPSDMPANHADAASQLRNELIVGFNLRQPDPRIGQFIGKKKRHAQSLPSRNASEPPAPFEASRPAIACSSHNRATTTWPKARRNGAALFVASAASDDAQNIPQQCFPALTSPALILAFSKTYRAPTITASDGFAGVDGVLLRKNFPFSSLYRRKSVNVPPTSTPRS